MDKNPLGQYFTPFPVAELRASLLTSTGTGSVVEPSAGEGVFIKALAEIGLEKVIPIEIDQRLALSSTPPMICASYLEWRPTTKIHAVIGNPPYIRWKNLSTTQREEVRRLSAWGTLLNSHTDYLMAFIWKAIEDLEAGGQLIFITPDYWIKTAHARNIREYMLKHGAFTHIVTFEEAKIFKGVTGSFIVFRWVKSQQTEKINLYRYTGPPAINTINKLTLNSSDFTSTEIVQFIGGDPWSLSDGKAARYADEFEKWCSSTIGLFNENKMNRLGDVVSIANGMVTGLDKAFAVTDDVVKDLPPSEFKAITNVVKGRDLMPLLSVRTRPYINIDPEVSPARFRAEYPTIAEWLEPFRTQLEKRYPYKNAPHYWNWSFRRSLGFHLSNRAKIVVPCKERITNKDRIRFALAPFGAVATQDVTAMAVKDWTLESIEYFCAFLCLKQTAEWIMARGVVKSGVAEFSEAPLMAIPIRLIDWKNPEEVETHAEIVGLVRLANRDPANLPNILLAIDKAFLKLGMPL